MYPRFLCIYAHNLRFCKYTPLTSATRRAALLSSSQCFAASGNQKSLRPALCCLHHDHRCRLHTLEALLRASRAATGVAKALQAQKWATKGRKTKRPKRRLQHSSTKEQLPLILDLRLHLPRWAPNQHQRSRLRLKKDNFLIRTRQVPPRMSHPALHRYKAHK